MSVNVTFHADWYDAEAVHREGAHWVSVEAHQPILGHPTKFVLHVETAEDAELLAAAFNGTSRRPTTVERPADHYWRMRRGEAA